MTIRVQRAVTVEAPVDRVWDFIADPAKRAGAISVVEDWTTSETGTTTWHIALPIPFLDRTVAVETEDVERRPGEYVKFRGTSAVMTLQGEHELTPVEGGTRLTNTFVVDGRIPGVERYFERNLDRELENLADALRADVATDA